MCCSGSAGEFPAWSGYPVTLAAMSALAEGSDQLVARDVLACPGSQLEAALPLPHGAYDRKFNAAAARAGSRALLARASKMWQAPTAVPVLIPRPLVAGLPALPASGRGG